MSLILEALRKLDKEKQAPERGFLVVAASAWPTAPPRRRIWVLAFLGIGAIAATWLLLAHRSPAPAPQTNRAAMLPAPAARPALPAMSQPTVAAVSLPTPAPPRAPRASTAPSPAALVLQAISSRDGRPIAIVSDRLVREGDSFDGVTIVRIGDAEVEIESGGHRSILHF